jgi:hypothetical protein
MAARTISFKNASLATLAHTSIVYGAPLFGLTQVPIAKLVGEGLLPGSSKCAQSALGMLLHISLGAALFPAAYNAFARYFLPRRQPESDFAWAFLLWFTGQNFLIPVLRKSELFRKHPDAVATYLLAHIAYGALCSRE